MLKPVSVTIGCDPELFVSKAGEILGSEWVLPKDGLRSRLQINPAVKIDGVQLELNPRPAQNIQVLGRNIAVAFEMLERQLKKFPGVKVDWRQTVDVPQYLLDQLRPETRILGSDPSKNIYGVEPFTFTDSTKYLIRSAGGHLHFGLAKLPYLYANREEGLVPLLDIFVGNTCVILDRDARAQERRLNYGRAGEYRIPAYGLEYRVLSNFWLQNYTLTDFVFGMAHLALAVCSAPDVEAELIYDVNIDKFRKAINTNDYDLAVDNFESIRPFLAKHLPFSGFPLTPKTVGPFLEFAYEASKEGIEQYFEAGPVEHWVSGEKVEFAEFMKGMD